MKWKKVLSTRTLLTLVLLAFMLPAILAAVPGAQAHTYTTVQLTDNSDQEFGAKIGGAGHIVWFVNSSASSGIFLHDGTQITQLTDSVYSNYSPVVNRNGQVAWFGWDGSDREIFFHDGTQVLQLTDNDYDDEYFDWQRVLNDAGQLVWLGDDLADAVFLYDGVTTLQLTGHVGAGPPHLNSAGQVVWDQWETTDREVFFYDGTDSFQFTETDYYDIHAAVNDSGQILWLGLPGPYFKREVYFFDGTTTTRLTDNDYHDFWPNMNNSGQAVWQGNGEIFYFDGTAVSQLTNSGTNGGRPRINDAGQIVWTKYDAMDIEVMLYNGTEIIQLTDNDFDDTDPWISDAGVVVWTAAVDGFDNEVMLASPVSGNTPVGHNVTVTPTDPDPITVENPVTVTFDEVTGAGETIVTSAPTGEPLPDGFRLGDPPVYFDIDTTAAFSGSIEVCVNYTGISFGSSPILRLFHHEDTNEDGITDKWIDVTTSVDIENEIICGIVSSFSAFAVFEKDYSFIGFLPPVENPPVVNRAKAGRNIPIKWQLLDAAGHYIQDIGVVDYLQFQPMDGCDGSLINTIEDAATAGNSGLRYDFESEQFVFTWKTEKSMTGCYAFNLTLFGTDQFTAYFMLE